MAVGLDAVFAGDVSIAFGVPLADDELLLLLRLPLLWLMLPLCSKPLL